VAVHDLELLYNAAKTELENQKLNDSVIMLKSKIRNNTIFLIIGLFIAVVTGIAAWFIYRLYKQRDAAYNTLFDQIRSGVSNLEIQILPVEKTSHPNAQLSVSNESIMNDIIEYFETEKPYLNSNLRLMDIARKFNINRTVLSQEIYEHSGVHFITFINRYRVAEALRLLSLPEYNSFKIETIAMKAGFGSRTSFYEAFTQITGSKPSEFRKDL